MRHLSPDVLTQTMMPYLMGMVMPPAPCQQPSVVCHDDLKGEHILIASAGDAITGIIDWSDLSLADPATDFAALSSGWAVRSLPPSCASTPWRAMAKSWRGHA
ncbi:MAG TPA: phosphotransferase, partial [Ktedonobacterales bacterium]|nr:phosphotransferase [Ktedonobacterales bacterium]